MTARTRDAFDVVIIGGGIAGNALATVLARAGKSVLVLERSTVYRDRVRGEVCHAWGVAELLTLRLFDTLMRAGGTVLTRSVPYDETEEPAAVDATAAALDKMIPDVPGALSIGHPVACEALGGAAAAAGARVLRGVERIELQLGGAPTVRYLLDGAERAVRCRLVIGADGRDSTVRRRAGLPMHATEPRLLGAGLLVDGIRDWPPQQLSIGTEGDRVFFIIPQAGGRGRLYLMYAAHQRRRFTGASAARDFLDGFRLECVPSHDGIVNARPAGPCAAYPMNDAWTDCPVADGLALIGDAAGYSDPHFGQGLSVAARDVRIVSELLLASNDWSPAALKPYVEERAERMRRLRFSTAMVLTLRGEFTPEARERRRRARQRMRADPELGLWLRAGVVGPHAVPASAFDDRVRERLFAPA
jgi:2-polyprenyl-6-methoxyphenol hydroxylase-like FAD-dependent oxidoreductase